MTYTIENDLDQRCLDCGEHPTYLIHDGDEILCGNCEYVLEERDDEPDHQAPDPFYSSNFYDITSRR